jgi:hypothetical protein
MEKRSSILMHIIHSGSVESAAVKGGYTVQRTLSVRSMGAFT